MNTLYMKKKLYPTFAFILLLTEICSATTPQDTIFIPKEIKQTSIKITTYGAGIFTVSNTNNTQFWQFNQTGNSCSLHFSFTENFHKEIYEHCFPGKKEFENTTYALEVNNAKEPLSKITSLYVGKDNEIYAFVTSLLAKPTSGRDPKKDFTLFPFLSIIKLGNEKIEKIFYIPEPVINTNEYVVFEAGNFFLNPNKEFILTTTKISETGKMQFLSKWKPDSTLKLFYAGMYDVELSPFHKEKKINYGLLNFIQKDGKIVFHVAPYIYNTSTQTITKFEVKNMPDPDITNLKYGGRFEIKYAACDFRCHQDTLTVLFRLNDALVLNHYAGKDLHLITTETLLVKVSELNHTPFFDDQGRILLFNQTNRIITYYQQ